MSYIRNRTLPLREMTVYSTISGFVLAGGASSRMGRDKALLELAGVPMLLRTARLLQSVAGSIAVVGFSEKYRPLTLPLLPDDWPGAGPLGGIATALRASTVPWNLVVACDLPYLTMAWLDYLVGRALSSQADAVLPTSVRGAEPLCAMYHKRCEPGIRAALSRGVRKVTDGLASLCIETVEPGEWKRFDSEGVLFENMNSPAEYEEAKKRLAKRAKPGA